MKKEIEILQNIKNEMIKEYEKRQEFYERKFEEFEAICFAYAAGYLSTLNIRYSTVYRYIHYEICKPLYKSGDKK